MAVSAAELVRDLKALRKGRGLLVARLGERIGPALRQVCDVLDTDSSAEVRKKLADRLLGLAARLPDDLRIAVLAAFGLHPEVRQPFYQERVRWAAEQLRRDERTARRRVDAGIEALAELAVSGADTADQLAGQQAGWHTSGLWVTLSLDLPNPEAFEYRRIIADRDGIDELDLSLTLTASNRAEPMTFRELDIDLFRGGTLVRWARESSDRFAFALCLPKPIMRGQTHDYAIRFRVPRGQVMQPHYVCVPKHRCEMFDLSVRFGANLPRRIWRLSEAFQRDVDDPFPHGDTLSADVAGEIHLTFRELTPGLAYGARWEEAHRLVAADPGMPNGYHEGAEQAEHHRLS